MTDAVLSRRTIFFVNIAHAFDHFVLLIYPTAVIAIAQERNLDYSDLISRATGSFVAFGLCSLPMGWLADRFGRRTMLGIFFFGYGASCVVMTLAESPLSLGVSLLILGVFSAIYHPIGTAMLVTHARDLGRDLGWNGVWGNLGAAGASAITAGLTAFIGWRMAFVVPGLICMACGVAFLWFVRSDGERTAQSKSHASSSVVQRPLLILAAFGIAIVAGGMTFNVTTIALPKIINEDLGLHISLSVTGLLATGVFVIGALTQLTVGRLLSSFALPDLFVGLSILQPVGLSLAAYSDGVVLLGSLALVTAAIYGQVVINDAMVARYIPEQYRAKAFSIRYFLSFTASGFAAPFIAAWHMKGGFPVVLQMTALFGVIVFCCALAFRSVYKSQPA
jgi:MFS family permease